MNLDSLYQMKNSAEGALSVDLEPFTNLSQIPSPSCIPQAPTI